MMPASDPKQKTFYNNLVDINIHIYIHIYIYINVHVQLNIYKYLSTYIDLWLGIDSRDKGLGSSGVAS